MPVKCLRAFLTKVLMLFAWIVANFLPTSVLADAEEVVSFTTTSKSLIALSERLPKRIVMIDVALGNQEPVDLILERYEAFSPTASFLVGDAGGEIGREPLKSITYYRGSVAGFQGSFAFLSVDEIVADIHGSVELADSIWNLLLDSKGQELIASKASRPEMKLPVDMGKDYEIPPEIDVSYLKDDKGNLGQDRRLMPKSSLKMAGSVSTLETSLSITEYNCNTDLYEQYDTLGWTREGGRHVLLNSISPKDTVPVSPSTVRTATRVTGIFTLGVAVQVWSSASRLARL